MAIPSLPGFTAGEKVTAAKLNQHTKQALEEAVFYKPFCHLWHSTVQSLPHGATTKLNLDTIMVDTDDMADTANSRLVIRTAGRYRITYNAGFVANTTGTRAIFLYRNGNQILHGASNAPGNSYCRIPAGWIYALDVGDTLDIRANQNSGAALNTDTQYGGCALMAEWISM